MFDTSLLSPMIPELTICGAALLFLVVGVYAGNRTTPFLVFGAILVMAFCLGVLGQGAPAQETFRGMFVSNHYIAFSKFLILLGAAMVLVLTGEWLKKKDHALFEYPVLILLSVLGMMVMVSSGTLLTLYIGLELTSLPLYVLAAFQRDSERSTESGLKYFVLGSLASGMMLFGISLIYGFSGTINLSVLGDLFALKEQLSIAAHEPLAIPGGLLIGLLLLIVGFCFKVSAVPFHMWAPDVYEGAPTPVTAFFAVAPKIAALSIFARLLLQHFGDLTAYWQQIVVFVSIASMLVGALGAIMQANIKRLLAYSSIGHVGYGLIGIATGTIAGGQALLIYLSLYLFMSVGAFGCVLLMRRKGEYVEDISELAGLAQTRPMMAAGLALFMFSMAGIPPLAGFFGKFYIFLAAVEVGLYGLAVIGVATSVIAAFYYLKIVKLMYFDEARTPFDREMTSGMRLVIGGCGVITLLFFLYPAPLIHYVKEAAQALAL